VYSFIGLDYPVGKIAIKQSEKCVFINSALEIQCHIVKNTLFFVILFKESQYIL